MTDGKNKSTTETQSLSEKITIIPMLSELPIQVQNEVHMLRQLMEGKGRYSSIEEREGVISKLQNHISDITSSILMREDRNKSIS